MRDLSTIPGAAPGPLPDLLHPMPVSRYAAPEEGAEWLHEIRHEGYRILARLEGGTVRLLARSGSDLALRFAGVASAVASLPAREAWLDGEMVVLRPDGTSSHADLQRFLLEGGSAPVHYMAFDLMYLDGYDLRGVELVIRKEILRQLVEESDAVRYVDHLQGSGAIVYRQACELGLDGIVSKEASSPYRCEERELWRQVLCRVREEFLIGGYTLSTGGNLIGSLLLGKMEEGGMRFAGEVGEGMTREMQLGVLETLWRYEQQESPFGALPETTRQGRPRWVRPQIGADVEYTPVAGGDELRLPSLKGIREIPEASRHPAAPAEAPRSIRRRDVEEHYRLVAGLMLPHIADRPLWLLRCPWGIHAECSPKRHANGVPPPARPINLPGHDEAYFTVDDADGLMALMEIGAFEIHSWQCRHRRADFPDRLVFDLDPGEGVSREALRRGTILVHDILQELGLRSFVKTSGRKGYHVHVPLVPEADWESVDAFVRAFSLACAQYYPGTFVSRAGPEQRIGRIFVDWMRNARANNSVDAWSLRASEGAPVAVPLEWRELEAGIAPDAFDIASIPRRLDRLGGDPWREYFDVRQTLPQYEAP